MNQKVKCKCSESFTAIPYTPPPLPPQKKDTKPKENIITKIWKGTPSPFKTAFLATMGVMAALFVSLNIYLGYIKLNSSRNDYKYEYTNKVSLTKYNFSIQEKTDKDWSVVLHMWVINPHSYFVKYKFNVEFMDDDGNVVAHTNPQVGNEPPHSGTREVTIKYPINASDAKDINLKKCIVHFDPL